MSTHQPYLTRRGALTLIAVSAAGAAMIPQRLLAQATDTSMLMPGADVCVLVPETTEGPFYFDPALVRRDITEGRPGLPLLMRMQIVDTACTPIEDARIDIWHCDADGVYSGYDNQAGGAGAAGETFMRGTQFTDARGIAEFATIYPGWYPGRTTHIHFKVFLGQSEVLTGQIFFPEEVNESVYASVAAYARDDQRATFNTNDGIARQAGASSVASVGSADDGYLAGLIVGVARPG